MADGLFGDFDLSKLWGFISGSGGSGLSGAQTADVAASALNPALSGLASAAVASPGSAANIASSISPSLAQNATNIGTGGASSSDLAKALGGLGKSSGAGASADQRPQNATLAQPQSAGVGRPSGQNLASLIQLLQQREQLM